MKISNFTLVFKEEAEGGFTVMVPSLPGCVTYGKTLEESKEMAKDAIKAYLGSLKKHNEIIPTEESVFLSTVNLDIRTLTYA